MTSNLEHKKILFISNGRGEDLIAFRLLEELKKTEKDLVFFALPLASTGDIYQDIPILLKGKEMPSGGFILTFRDFFKDLFAGLFSLTLKQLIIVLKYRKKFDLVIAVGDIYPLFLSTFFKKAKKIFISSAKTSFVGEHNKIEISLMQKKIDFSFARDKLTTEYFAKNGIKTEYVGNVMMDCIQASNYDFGIKKAKKIIGILPGSRKEAYKNLSLIKELVLELNKQNNNLFFLLSKPSSLQADKIFAVLGEIDNLILTDKFADILASSELFIGLAGTANEQAVGMGKFVITFKGLGPQTSEYRMRIQKKVLGDSVVYFKNFDKRIIAQKIIELIQDPASLFLAEKSAKERMGKAGASAKIINIINQL